MEIKTQKEIPHHQQYELCKTRPRYRQGRKLTAVKSYTINNESQHLFVYGVPQINLRSELKNLCSKYGQVASIHVVTDCKTEKFTECYHVQFERIQSARVAKRFIDDKSFYGGVLHVCYAPEFETVPETRAKLQQRCKDVLKRLGYEGEPLNFLARRNKPRYKEIKKRNTECDDAGGGGDSNEEDPMIRDYFTRESKRRKGMSESDCNDFACSDNKRIKLNDKNNTSNGNENNTLDNNVKNKFVFLPTPLLKDKCNLKRIVFHNNKNS